MAEEQTVGKVYRHGTQLNGDKRAFAARAERMNDVCKALLSCSGLALKQDIICCGSHPCGQPGHRLLERVPADLTIHQ